MESELSKKLLYQFDPASMEPQGLGCGVRAFHRRAARREIRFNGATGFRLWSRGTQAASEGWENRFNGATGFRLWSLIAELSQG